MHPDAIKPITSLSANQLEQFASADQRRAVGNKNEAALKMADDRALAEAILASLADLGQETLASTDNTLPSPNEASSSQSRISDDPPTAYAARTPTQAEYEANRKINQQLDLWLDQHGFQVIPNTGRDANCLLISMTQHAAGNYTSEHSADVVSLRQKVKDYTRMHHPNNPSMNDYSLYSDGKFMTQLAQEVNDGIKDPNKQLTFCIATADLNGQPSWRKVGDGPRMAVIVDRGGHYEAVIPREISAPRRATC